MACERSVRPTTRSGATFRSYDERPEGVNLPEVARTFLQAYRSGLERPLRATVQVDVDPAGREADTIVSGTAADGSRSS